VDPIQVFRREEIPEVLALFRAAFVRNGNSGPGHLDTYLDRVFFESPWYDEELPSFVYRDRSGAIIGFAGVQPRPLLLDGRPLRGAVATKLMVSPTSGDPLAAGRLLKRVFAGRQDLLFSDLGTDAGRRMWEGLGGKTALLYSLHWQRPVRPARHVLAWLRARGVPGLIAGALRPLCAVTDGLMARWGARPGRAALAGHTIDDLPVDVMAAQFGTVCADRALRPAYDERALEWLLRVAQQNDPRRVLRRRVVRDARAEVVGWFVYLVEPGGVSEVLQLIARKGAADVVFQFLLADAWSAGAAMLGGRLEPTMVREMSERRSYFRQTGPWALAHAKDPAVLAAVLSGSAFLSRLEGEW
jgi:hypothetical protein